MTTREFYLHRLRIEYPVTLKVLQALPQSKLSYKPDERSPSAEQLAWLLTNELEGCIEVIKEFKTNWKTAPPPPMAQILQRYEEAAKTLAGLVSAADGAAWDHKAGFYYEGKLVAEHAAGDFLWLTLFDSIHHRGQLTSYLRPMGGKVPAIYGPSADETQGHGAWQ